MSDPAGRVLTCAGSLNYDGTSSERCCVTDCGQPAPYASLYDEGVVLREHLRCVVHAEQDRLDHASGWLSLLAMKSVSPPARETTAETGRWSGLRGVRGTTSGTYS